jgi:hypothetical protein
MLQHFMLSEGRKNRTFCIGGTVFCSSVHFTSCEMYSWKLGGPMFLVVMK